MTGAGVGGATGVTTSSLESDILTKSGSVSDNRRAIPVLLAGFLRCGWADC